MRLRILINSNYNQFIKQKIVNLIFRFSVFYFNISLKILSDMEKSGPEPNIYTYNTVTRAFAESGKFPFYILRIFIMHTQDILYNII